MEALGRGCMHLRTVQVLLEAGRLQWFFMDSMGAVRLVTMLLVGYLRFFKSAIAARSFLLYEVLLLRQV